MKELQSMLKDPTTSPTEYLLIKQNIEDLKAGRMKEREKKLKQMRVVGIDLCIQSLNSFKASPAQLLFFPFWIICAFQLFFWMSAGLSSVIHLTNAVKWLNLKAWYQFASLVAKSLWDIIESF